MSNTDGAAGAPPAAPNANTDLPTRQDPVTFDVEGRATRGVLHRLQESSAQPRAAVAIVEGVAGGGSDRVVQALSDLAEALARVNMVGLRLSLREREVTSFEDQVREAQHALDVLAQQQEIDIDHLAIVGTGWSIRAAACLAKHDPRVAGVVVWDLAWKATTDGPGVELGDCARFYPGQPSKDLPAKVLIVHGAPGESQPEGQAQQLTRALEDAGIASDATVFGGDGDGARNPGWEQQAIQHTVEWLQSALTSGE